MQRTGVAPLQMHRQRFDHLTEVHSATFRRESLHPGGRFDRHVIVPLVFRNVLVDHAIKGRILAPSGLDWVIVCRPRQTNGPHTGRYRSGIETRERWMGTLTSRADLVEFMPRQLATQAFVRRTSDVMS